MLGSKFIISSLLAVSIVEALQCNGCRGCLKRLLEVSESESIGVYARWWFGDSVPKNEHIEAAKREGAFEVVAKEHGGEYFEKPEGAVGLIVSSAGDHAAVAGWIKANKYGPWQAYGEQNPNTSKFHYLADTKLVFVGLI